MKWMIASDIHGSAYYCRQLLEAFEQEQASRLILLGDLLYHGPRNDLPKEYAPKLVIPMLNARKQQLVCVRGNCDTDVDQMVLDFPILAEYGVFCMDGVTLYATHGHRFDPDAAAESHALPLTAGDILLYGHTHVPRCERVNGLLLCNPGSVSIPKEGSAHSYMIIEQGKLCWKSLNGALYMEQAL